MSDTISIKGLNRAVVLAALYNAAKPQEMGFIHYDPTPMTTSDAQKLIDAGHLSFDYLKGRVMKISLEKNEVGVWGYDRDNGEGAAAKAVSEASKGSANSEAIQKTHKSNTLKAAKVAMHGLDEESRVEGGCIRLGLNDDKEHLGPKVHKAVQTLRK